MMPCGWEGNRRSGIALAMRHRLQWFIHLWGYGLRKGDEHPTYTPHGVWHSFTFLYPLLMSMDKPKNVHPLVPVPTRWSQSPFKTWFLWPTDPHESMTQTASQSAQLFLHGSPMCATHRHIPTDHRTHTNPFNGPLSRTTRVSRYQKGKTNLDFTGARDSEWQWHQRGHMQVCTSLQTDNHASTPQLSFLQAGCPSCRPTNSVTALKTDHGTSVIIGHILCYTQKWCLTTISRQRQQGNRRH